MNFCLPTISRAALRRIFAWLLVGLCLGGSACSRKPVTEVRVAINPWPGCEFLYLAQEKGFFAEEGIKIRLVDHTSLSDCRVALQTGNVHGMVSSLIEVLHVHEHTGKTPEIAMVIDNSNGADVILGRSDLTSVAALKGKRIGLELGSLSVFILGRALELHGLRMEDVHIVACQPTWMEEALRQNQVDAVVTYAPTSVALESKGIVRPLFSSADIAGEVVDLLVLDAAVLRRQPGLPGALQRAFQRAQEYARQHPQEAYTLMGQHEGLSAAEFEKALKGIKLVSADEQSAFLGPQGSLIKAKRDVERMLRVSGQMPGSHSLPPVSAPTGAQKISE